MKTLKWLVLSTNKQGFGPCPKEVVMRPAKTFKELLEKRTNGNLQVELIEDFGAYKDKYNKEVTYANLFDALRDDDVSIAQVEVSDLGGEHYAFDLPWTFKSHEHASKVLEGHIGTYINKGLEKRGMKGLAYTYSGGYRAFGSFDTIPTIEDFKGKKVLINSNPITADYMKALGLEATRESKDVDFRDTTYIRFKEAKSFLKSGHSLFLTDIVVSKKFYDSCTKDEQDALNTVAKEVANLERGWTTQDAKEFEALAGCEIVELSDADRSVMQEKAKELYKTWEDKYFPGKGFVKQIAKLQ